MFHIFIFSKHFASSSNIFFSCMIINYHITIYMLYKNSTSFTQRQEIGLFKTYSFNHRISKSSRTLSMFSKEAVRAHREVKQTIRETTVVFVQEMRTTLPQDCFHWLDSLSCNGMISSCEDLQNFSKERTPSEKSRTRYLQTGFALLQLEGRDRRVRMRDLT